MNPQPSPPEAPDLPAGDSPERSFIDLVVELAALAPEAGLEVRALIDRLDERAFALPILIMAIPCLVPGLPGPPQIFGVPIILLAGQMLLGRREPWLPGALLRRKIPRGWLVSMGGFADKRLRWLERLSKPRWRFLATGIGERVIALFMILATLVMMPPITNSVPALALTLMSVGILQRDGIFAGLGSMIAVAWIGLLVALVVAFSLGAGFAVDFLAKHAPWLADIFARFGIG